MIIKNTDFETFGEFSLNSHNYKSVVKINLNKKFSYYNFNFISLCSYIYRKTRKLNEHYQNLLFTKRGKLKEVKNNLLNMKYMYLRDYEETEKEFDFLIEKGFSNKGEMNINEEVYNIIENIKTSWYYKLEKLWKEQNPEQYEFLLNYEKKKNVEIIKKLTDEQKDLITFSEEYDKEMDFLLKKKMRVLGVLSNFITSLKSDIKQIDERIKFYHNEEKIHSKPFPEKLNSYDIFLLFQNKKIRIEKQKSDGSWERVKYCETLPFRNPYKITDNLKKIYYYYMIYLKKVSISSKKADYLKKTSFPIRIETTEKGKMTALVETDLKTFSPYNDISELLWDYSETAIYEDIPDYVENDLKLFENDFLNKMF